VNKNGGCVVGKVGHLARSSLGTTVTSQSARDWLTASLATLKGFQPLAERGRRGLNCSKGVPLRTIRRPFAVFSSAAAAPSSGALSIDKAQVVTAFSSEAETWSNSEQNSN